MGESRKKIEFFGKASIIKRKMTKSVETLL